LRGSIGTLLDIEGGSRTCWRVNDEIGPVTGRTDHALDHLRRVTGMIDAETSRHVHAAGELWARRSARVWELDLSMLTDAGVTLARPDKAADRAAAAERALQQRRSNGEARLSWPLGCHVRNDSAARGDRWLALRPLDRPIRRPGSCARQ
jgi:hypothetical protein